MDRVKCPSVAAGCELSEDPAIETELSFDDEVQEVIRHEGVVARCWIHHKLRQPWAHRLYGVSSLSRSVEDQHHVAFGIKLPKRWPSAAAGDQHSSLAKEIAPESDYRTFRCNALLSFS